MKRYFYCFATIIAFLSGHTITAQRKEVFEFQEKTFDFGHVKEDGGPVSHTFEFINASNQPLKILSVNPSCGCTTPDWTKDPVKPGGKGFVTATYDPNDRPGYFDKQLTITTNANSEPIILNIKGTVTLKGDLVAFRHAIGNWRLIASSFNVGKIWIKDEFAWKEYEVLNAGESAITVQLPVASPAYIKVNVVPLMLRPGEKGVIQVGYNGKLKDAYGFQSDNVEITTNDADQARKSFSVYATLEEFFPELSAEEREKAPRLALTETTLDMGHFSSSNAVEKQISISNTGKKTLSIRYIQPNCQCMVATVDKSNLEPGKSAVLTVRLDPKDRRGTQQKFITLYSNDPVNPVQRLSVTAYIER
jgi:hypothetical protein